MTVLVTGANGFVGRALCEYMLMHGKTVRAAMRQPDTARFESVRMPDLGPDADWTLLLHGVDAVIHTAARVHVMQDHAVDPLAEFRRSNTEGTLRLARQAADAGVKRFVYVSSIKVNGEWTLPGAPFVAKATGRPSDPYGISKREAEDGLMALAQGTGLEVVIVRPPLVYGPGVKANFLRMMSWIERGWPLPLGAIDNRRSLVALDNLVDLLMACAYHPGAANRTFLVSDDEDVSTTDLLRRLARVMGKPARLIPIPPAVLEFGCALIGRRDIGRRLCDSLQVDCSETRAVLGWNPVIGVDAAFEKTAAAFFSDEVRRRNAMQSL